MPKFVRAKLELGGPMRAIELFSRKNSAKVKQMAEVISSREQSEIQTAHHTLRQAPWYFAGSLVIAAMTLFWGRISIQYLAVSAAAGVIWFVLLITAWRFRREMLGYFSLILVAALLSDSSNLSVSFQRILIALSTAYALMILLRSQVRRFARI